MKSALFPVLMMLAGATAEFCLLPCACPMFPDSLGFCEVPCVCPIFPWERQYRGIRQAYGDVTYPPETGDDGIIYPRGPYEPTQTMGIGYPSLISSLVILICIALTE